MVVLGVLVATVSRAASTDVRLAPASPGSVRFTVTVPEPAFTPTGDPSGETVLSLEGFDLEGEAGAPPQPVRVITIAVPPLGDVRVSAVASDVAVREGLLLAPRMGADAAGNERYVRRPEAYGTAGLVTPPAARLLEITWLRNQRIARIAIEPGAYAPSARRFALARRVDVDVQVQPMGVIGPPAEPDDPFESIYRSVLANYDQGRAWRRPGTPELVAAARRMNLSPATALAVRPPDSTSALFGHTWLKIAVRSTGFYSVNFSTLRTTQLFGNQGARFDSLRLFTLAGYPLLPERSYCDTCGFSEVAIGTIDTSDPADPTYHGGPDGAFGYNTDTFYFFGQAPSGWGSEFDPSLPDTNYLDHPYDNNNYYFLTIATADAPVGGTPKRIATRLDVTPTGGATAVTTFPERAHFEQDLEYWPDATSLGSTLTWEKWFWSSMTPGGGFDFAFDLPGADTTQAARFRLRQWGVTDNGAFFNASPCPRNQPDHYLDASFNAVTFPRRSWIGYTIERGGVITYDTTGTILRRTGNSLQLRVPVVSTPACPNRADRSALAWFEIYYARTLLPTADTLAFRSPGSAGPYRYDVGPFVRATPPRLFDVTDPTNPVELHVGLGMWAQGASGWTLSFEDTASVVRRYRAFPDSVISIARVAAASISLASLTTVTDNLRGHSDGADDLVIYYDGFLSAANALASARTNALPLVGRSAPFLTKIVSTSAIYDQFSGGRTDPAAIRNFLRAAFFNWNVRPTFVTFLGDASYDYKNITGHAAVGQPGCLVPTYENGFDNYDAVLRQFATDDWLLNVTDPNSFVPDFCGGRIPADDASTALQVVNQKVLAYENTSPLGEYRNEALFLSDDDLQGDNCDQIGWGHLVQTDVLAANDVPLHVDRDYVYLHTFPTGPGGTKPGARTELKKRLNQGVALFNFVGHGSPFKITDESVFIDSDAGSLTNGSRMFAFVAASCDVGKFSDPTVQSLGERLFMAPTSGAIAVISATERALSSQNSNLNRFLYDQLFLRGPLPLSSDTLAGNGTYHVPLSAALLSAKLRAPGTAPINNTKYQLMGDPATRLDLPRLWTDVTLTDLNGAPLTQVQRGQTVEFHGVVRDQPSGAPATFDGVASVLVEDSAPVDNTYNNPYDVGCYTHDIWSVNYRFTPGPVFHGDVSVTGGQFSGRFVVPMDATLGSAGRVRAYLQGSTAQPRMDGVGAISVTLAAGTAPTGDTQGPRITLSFQGGASSVRPDATLKIDLFDESGIMITGHTLINSIVVTLDDNTTSRTDVTSSFRYAADSYQGGTASFTLPGLAPGHHRVSVSAADNLATGITASQHRNSATIEFDVVNVPSLSIARAYLFPNPARSTGAGAGGTFIVDAPGDSLNTFIRIFTVSGRVIRDLKRFGGQGQVQIPWDGRDAEGDPLANGTYLFKVYANAREADGTSSAREKAATEGRFVIVNR
jgi:hypothetical protein